MYSYIYDSFLQDKKYQKPLIQLENRLTDLGLLGNSRKLTILDDIKKVIAEELQNNIHTLVAVGSDRLVSVMIDILAQHKICMGIIPFGEKTAIAEMLHIPPGIAAAENLARRHIKKIHLGKINDHYFIRVIAASDSKIKIVYQEKFSVSPIMDSNIYVFNNYLHFDENMDDYSLTTVVEPKSKRKLLNLFRKENFGPEYTTFMPSKTMKITNSGSSKLMVDGQKVVKTPAIVEGNASSLKIIVGKAIN